MFVLQIIYIDYVIRGFNSFVNNSGLGIESGLAQSFMDDILSRELPFGVAIWNNWLHRNIAVEHSVTHDSMLYIRLTAYDKLFAAERND